MKLTRVWMPDFKKSGGLIDVVGRDLNGHILYAAKATEPQWRETLETGRMACGSGKYKEIVTGMSIDCDGDAIVCTVAGGVGDLWTVDGQPDFATLPNGLVPVMAQDIDTFDILMLAYTDPAGLRETQDKTREEKKAVYFSRRRGRWAKGEESGNWQDVIEVLYSQESSALIYKVHQLGPGACHLNARSCFFRSILADQPFLMPVPEELGPGDTLQMVELPVHRNLFPALASA